MIKRILVYRDSHEGSKTPPPPAMKIPPSAASVFAAFVFWIPGDRACAAVPNEIRQELDQVFEALENTLFTGRSDYQLAERYWLALKKLGPLATPELQHQLASELKPVETESLAIAGSLKEGEQQLEELSQWYGRYVHEVPFELRKKQFAGTIWEQWEKEGAIKILPSDNSRKIRTVARLRDEHATETYRHAWEACLLAPGSNEKRLLLSRANEAIARLANPHSLPILLEAFKDAVRDRDMKLPEDFRDERTWALIYTIHSFKSEAALLALLECREIALKAGVGPGTAIYFVNDKSFDESFIRLLTSGRHDPTAPPFNDMWKAYLPHIKAQLARRDLPEESRSILEKLAKPLRSRKAP